MAVSVILPQSTAPVSNGFTKSLLERAVAKSAADGVLTVAQAFGELFTALEMTDAERSKASKQQDRVRARLDDHLELDATYLSGSYRRRTLIRPVDDIDLLVVLNWDEYKGEVTLDAAGTGVVLDLVERALEAAYPHSELHRYGRCIQIQFAGTGIGFDVVPAFQFADHEFQIADEDYGRWIRTNPREVEQLVSTANGRTDGWLVPLIKLLKAWKDERKVPLRGYHLEAMAYHALQQAPANEREGIATLFELLSSSVLLTTPDIWPAGESPSAQVSQETRMKAARQLQQAGESARRAIAAEEEGRPNDAHAIWFSLFGRRYPESGEEKVAKAMSYADSVKAIRTGALISANSRGLIYASSSSIAVKSPTSHGGLGERDAKDDVTSNENAAVATSDEASAIALLEWQIERAMAQFSALKRITPEEAAADPTLWPVREKSLSNLYCVLVGEQRTAFGACHRILVTVPRDMPGTEPRIYRLDRKGSVPIRPDGRRAAQRLRRHEWIDGAMCTHARRDRWDGMLVTLLIYAADWLFRQEYWQRTGKWIGREIDTDGSLLINGEQQEQTRATRPRQRHRPGRT